MNLQNVFPWAFPGFQDELIDMAKTDWLRVEPIEEGGADMQFVFNHELLSPNNRRYLGATLDGRFAEYGGGSKGAVWLYSISRLIAEGPKLFRASEEQCEAMTNVEVNIPLADYRQPFPTMLVELPAGYREQVDAVIGGMPKCPRHVLLRHWPGKMLFCGCQIEDQAGLPAELVYVFGGEIARRSMEECLQRETIPDPTESSLVMTICRVAINLALLLTQTASKLVPSDPAGMQKARRNLDRGVKPDLQRREIQQHVSLIIPDQPVVVRRTARQIANGAAPVGYNSKTHWVRGHWRAYPGFGLARGRGEQVPLLFVRPYLVQGESPDVPGAAYVMR